MYNILYTVPHTYLSEGSVKSDLVLCIVPSFTYVLERKERGEGERREERGERGGGERREREGGRERREGRGDRKERREKE